MTPMQISLAIQSLRPNVEWTMNDDDFENINWHTEGVKPLTRAEVEGEVARLEKVAADETAGKIAAKESALAKLAALGLTEEEAKAIFGGNA